MCAAAIVSLLGRHRCSLTAHGQSALFYVYVARVRAGGCRRPVEGNMEALAQVGGYLVLVLMAALIVAAIEIINHR